jgi:transposase
MSRPKLKIDEQTIQKAEEAYSTLKEGNIALKLLTIIAYGSHPINEVARIFKTHERNIYRWLEKFKQGGIEGLKPKAKGHPRELLNEEQKSQIEEWIVTRRDYQKQETHWTLTKLSESIESYYGIKIKKTAIAENLQKLGITQRMPRPVHHLGNKEQQTEFKKN